ncbi:unnamed protein product [Symbiodinium sp. CCMP2592]|nr:unnamed protein product [Symbiodinium sp. CCMP2592]
MAAQYGNVVMPMPDPPSPLPTSAPVATSGALEVAGVIDISSEDEQVHDASSGNTGSNARGSQETHALAGLDADEEMAVAEAVQPCWPNTACSPDLYAMD